jgi:hypothetical protein
VNRNACFRTGRFALAGLFLLLTALPAFSQQCALCYTQAASAGQRMIEALRSGILILIIPPTLGSVGMIFVVHRKRNQVRRTDGENESTQDW